MFPNVWLNRSTSGVAWTALAIAHAVSGCTREIPANPEAAHWKEFEIITCRGVNQSAVQCNVGEERRFDGALVCKLDGPWAGPPPRGLCPRLPHGCQPFVANLGPAASAAGSPDASPPRCSPSDPDCGPQRFGGECLEGGGYVWGAGRKPVFPYPFGGPCESDGDCSIDVAEPTCRACDSRFSVVRRRGCKTPRGVEWDRTFCGCVEQHCDFFRQ
jgi:hypothetical protein